ncbi:CoA transferase [Pluralibacter gergoviae]|nr:CoA transferase [Pluralibacter gergoviae]ELK5591737.1 CoA transferase [Pluralibacter gergoviae]
MKQLPLSGITVVSIEHAIAAPFCTRQLADFGARVIKVERTGTGDFARGYDERVNGISSHFVWTNRSKESIALDLKSDEGSAVLHRLIGSADVFIQNLAPGAAARMGLDWESLSAQYPGLIVCDISGYGDSPAAPGPYRDKRAYDLLIQSESGFLSVTGSADTPAKAGISIADIAAGMYSLTNILAALNLRSRTGRGQRIDISMLESMAEWMSFPLYYTFNGAEPPVRTGASHATIYPYGPFPAQHGESVLFGVQNEREWQRFCATVLRRPALADDPCFISNSLRVKNRELLNEIIISVFRDYPAADILQRLDAAQIANARMNELKDLWQHPQLRARQRWVTIDTPAGPVPALLPPGIASADDAQMTAVPALGEHTQKILAELHYAPEQISQLKKNNII